MGSSRSTPAPVPVRTPLPTPARRLEWTPQPTPARTLEWISQVTRAQTLEWTPQPTPARTLEWTPQPTPARTLEWTPQPTPARTLEWTPQPTPARTLEWTPQPKPVQKPELDKPWRKFNWDQKEDLKKRLIDFSVRNPDGFVGIMVAGQIGAGKSSFINSVSNAFQGRITSGAMVNSSAGASTSFTRRLKTHRIKSGNLSLPFVLRDIMGLEPESLRGSQPDDIVSAVFGHVKEGYKFDQNQPLTYQEQQFNIDPNPSEQAFCLVYVIDAATVQFTDDRLIEKLKVIRQRISDKGIPQVVVMTKVDEACLLVNKDLRKVYTSKKIKEKMQLCSDKVGVPMNYIFPVKNYHDEIDTDDDVDVLILKAFEQIVQLANDRLEEDICN